MKGPSYARSIPVILVSFRKKIPGGHPAEEPVRRPAQGPAERNGRHRPPAPGVGRGGMTILARLSIIFSISRPMCSGA
jgi:hypothetical protein